MNTPALFRITPASAALASIIAVIIAGHSTQAATKTWNDEGTVWATGSNWVGGSAPANSLTTDIALFNSTTFTNQPDYGTTSVNGIEVGDGVTLTGPLALTGTTLSLGSGGIVIAANAGTVSLGNAVKIGANQSWANNSSSLFTVGATVTNVGNSTAFTLTLNGSGSGGTNLTGIISDGGTTGKTAVTVNTTGGGVTTLSGVNTYTGNTTLSGGILRATTSAAALGAGSLTLGSAELQLANDTGLNFGRNTSVNGATTITSDRLSAGEGVTHTLGTLSIGARTLSINAGSNVTSGTAGVTFGTTTLTGAAIFDTGSGTNLTLGQIASPSNFAFTKQGSGQLTLNTASTRGGSTSQTTLNGGTLRLGVLNALGLGSDWWLFFNSGTLSIGVDTGGTVNGTRLSVGSNTMNLELDRATEGPAVTNTFHSITIGTGQLNVTAGSNVTSGTAGAIFNASTAATLTANGATFDTAANTNLTLGAISGAYVFTKQGAGQLTLNTTANANRNTSAAGATLSSGTLRLGAQNALGSYTGAVSVLTLNGGTLSLATDTGTTFNGTAMTVGGDATIEVDRATAGAGLIHSLRGMSIGGGHTLTVTAGNNVTSGTAGLNAGAITLTGASTFSVGSGTRLTLAAMTNDAHTATFTGAGNVAQNGVWGGGSGTGGITFDSGFSGTAVLNQANTFASGSTIALNGGTFYLNNTSVLGSALLSIGSGTTIDNATSSTYVFASGYTQQWNGNWTFGGTTNSLLFTNSGAITLTADVQVTLDGTRNLTEGGTITGAHNLTLNTIGTGQFLIPATVNNGGNFTVTGTAGQLANISGAVGSNVGDITNTSTGGVTLSNAIGNTGKLINQGTGAGAFTASGIIADTVTDLVQDSSQSTMVVSGVNNGAGGFATGTGTVTIKNGTLQVGGASIFGNGNVVTIGSSGTLDLNNIATTIGGLGDGTGAGMVTNVTGTNTRILTLGNSNTYSFSGAIVNGGQPIGITKIGTGSQTLSGDNTYTGNTSVNLGTLVLSNDGSKGSLGGTAVQISGPNTANGGNVGSAPSSVLGNATLQINGDYTIGTTSSGRLNVPGGDGTTTSQGTLSFVNGSINTLTLLNDTTTAGSVAQTLAFGGGGSTNSFLNIEVGAAGADKIVVGAGTAKVYIGNSSNAVLVNVTGLGGLNGTQQTIIDAPGGVVTGVTGNTSNFANVKLGTTSGNFGGHQVAIGNTSTAVYLTETANASPTNAYFNGAAAAVLAQGGTTAFNSFVDGNTNTSNFGTGAGGTGNANGLLGGDTNVFFDTNVTAPVSTSLGQDLTVNSVTFSTGSTVAIGGASVLTINAAAVSGNTAGNGIHVQTGSGNHTLGSKIALADHQTWTVTDSGTILTASNEISGSGKTLTKAGSGTLALSGANTYSGGTTVSAGKLLVNNSTGSGTGSGALTIDSGATLGGSGTISGTTSIAGTLSPGNSPGTLTFDDTLTWVDGGHYNWQVVDATGLAGTGFDTVVITSGGLDLTGLTTGGFTINLWSLASIGPDVDGDATNFDNSINQSWTLVSGTGDLTGIVGSIFNVNVASNNGTAGFSNNLGGGSFSVVGTTNSLELVFIAGSVIPEPSTYAALFGIAALGFAAIRRRKQKQSA